MLHVGKNEKQLFLHIGLPKCASTFVQSLFSASDSIDYYGLIPEEPLHVANQELNQLLNRDLRFSLKQADYFRTVLNKIIESSNKKNIVISSENIALRFLPWDVPTHLKLNYLNTVLPENTRVILVYRNPLDLMKSLYKEWVLLGYCKSYSDFVEEIFLFREFSFFDDLLIHQLLKNIQQYLPGKEIQVYFLNHDAFPNNLCADLKISPRHIPENKFNISLSDQQVMSILQSNNTNNDFINFFDRIELHRSYPELDDSFKFETARKRRARKNESIIPGTDNAARLQLGPDNLGVLETIISDFEDYQSSIRVPDPCVVRMQNELRTLIASF